MRGRGPQQLDLSLAAQAYVAAGLHVLPLHTPGPGGCSCRHPDCPSPGKHPRLLHGLRQASADPRQVRAWWRQWPDANIGVRTGTAGDVCDIDKPQRLATVLGLTGGRPLGPVARTGSGGWHLWWAATGQGNRVGLLAGVDWRGRGGYVVAPPSLHASGRRYEWLRPLEAFLPPCPPRLLRLLAGPRTAPVRPFRPVPPQTATAWVAAALEGETARVAGARVGERNHTLNASAFRLGQLVGAGLLDGYIVTAALTRAARRCGLGDGEIVRTIGSGLTAGRKHPRGPDRARGREWRLSA